MEDELKKGDAVIYTTTFDHTGLQKKRFGVLICTVGMEFWDILDEEDGLDYRAVKENIDLLGFNVFDLMRKAYKDRKL